MIADVLLDFYRDADLKAALTTSKVVDLKQDHPNLGSCVPPFYVILKVKDTSGDGTVTFNLQDSADNATFATVASVTVAGKDLVDTAIPVPVKHRRYLKLVTAVTGTVAGTLQRAVLNNVYDLPRTVGVEGYDQVKTID